MCFGLTPAIYADDDYLEYDHEAEKARELFNQGIFYYNNYSYEAAINKFFQSLTIRGKENRVRYWLGMAFYKAGYTGKAIHEWKNIIKLGGHDSLLIQKINNIHYRKGKGIDNPVYDDYVFYTIFPNSSFTNLTQSRFPTALHADKKNRLFFLDFKLSRLSVINPNGRITDHIFNYSYLKFPGLRTIEAGVSEAGINFDFIKSPYDMVHDEKGGFWITDFEQNKIYHVNKNGKILTNIGKDSNETSTNSILGPEGITKDAYGNLYTVDTGNCRIVVHNTNGKFLFSFAQRGRNEGNLMLPSGICAGPEGTEIYVCDRGNNRISVFDHYGTYLRSFGTNFLLEPRSIDVVKSRTKTFLISDRKNVYLYKEQENLFKALFHNVSHQSFQKIKPLGTTIGHSGFLYVGDAISGKIHVFSPLKLKYVNLVVQAENIYLRDFPKVAVTTSVFTKENLPVSGLQKQNFEILENGVRKEFIVNPKDKKYENKRITILVEKTQKMYKSRRELENVLKSFLTILDPNDKARLFTYGGEKPEYNETLPYNRSVLKNTESVMKGKWENGFHLGSVLKKAINVNLDVKYKKAIIIFTASEITAEHFLPENFNVIADYAKHNFIPIYVVYIGKENMTDKNFYHYKELCRLTKGELYVYENTETFTTLLHHIDKFQNGNYTLVYNSFENTLKSGYFRNLQIIVNYKGMSGTDRNAGYPIP